jgi:hypothetical protein
MFLFMKRTLLTTLDAQASSSTECSFTHLSHKQITNYATKPLEFLPFCVLIWSVLSHTLGCSAPEENEKPSAGCTSNAETRPVSADGSRPLLLFEACTWVHFRTELWSFGATLLTPLLRTRAVWEPEAESKQTGRRLPWPLATISLHISKVLFAG